VTFIAKLTEMGTFRWILTNPDPLISIFTVGVFNLRINV